MRAKASGPFPAVAHAKAAVLAEPGVAAFVAWVAGKPPDFHAPTKGKKR